MVLYSATYSIKSSRTFTNPGYGDYSQDVATHLDERKFHLLKIVLNFLIFT